MDAQGVMTFHLLKDPYRIETWVQGRRVWAAATEDSEDLRDVLRHFAGLLASQDVGVSLRQRFRVHLPGAGSSPPLELWMLFIDPPKE